MSEYKFSFDEKKYLLNESNCSGLINDEDKPVKGINISHILEILNNQKYIGYLSEDEYYDIESEFRKKYFGNNILDIQQINNMYNEIKIHDSELYEKLKYILEKSIKDSKNIYILVK